jgi:hypothetical protein
MSILEIAARPTTVEVGNTKIHESILRSYGVLEVVKYYLAEGVPNKIVLQLIEEMTPDNSVVERFPQDNLPRYASLVDLEEAFKS